MAIDLVPHPDSQPTGITSVCVRWYFARGGRFLLRYLVTGVDALDVPEFAGRARADDLWQATCFEMFLKSPAGDSYAEFNFSPSGRWAAYYFTGYREGRTDIDLDDAPVIECAGGQFLFAQTVTMDASLLQGAGAMGLSAVIVEKDGTKSYWAVRHGPGKPDFHDAACFAAPVPAPRGR